MHYTPHDALGRSMHVRTGRSARRSSFSVHTFGQAPCTKCGSYTLEFTDEHKIGAQINADSTASPSAATSPLRAKGLTVRVKTDVSRETLDYTHPCRNSLVVNLTRLEGKTCCHFYKFSRDSYFNKNLNIVVTG